MSSIRSQERPSSPQNAANAATAEWSKTEIELLMRLKQRGLSNAEIVRHFKDAGFSRAEGAIAVKATRVGVSAKSAQTPTRNCLCCRQTFQPEARSIYICTPCKEDPAFSQVGEYYVLQS